jgi:hypothetical protein
MLDVDDVTIHVARGLPELAPGLIPGLSHRFTLMRAMKRFTFAGNS